MVADNNTPAALPQLKPEKALPAQFFKGAAVGPPQTEPVERPDDSAVMRLPTGDWCDKDAALLVLLAEGKRAANKSAKGIFHEVNGGGGASAREQSLREVYKLLQKDNLKGISRKLYGHDKAQWFDLSAIMHPEVRTHDDRGEPVEVEPQWDAE